MRILQIYEPAVGGVPRYVHVLADELESRGHVVGIAGPNVRSDSKRQTMQLFTQSGMRLSLVRLVRSVKTIAINSRDYDLIHAHSSLAGAVGALAGWWTRVPTVYTPHSWSFERGGGRVSSTIFALLEKFFATFHENIITVSERERMDATRRKVASSNKVTVVATGVRNDAPLISRNEARSALGLMNDGLTVVAWVGRADPQKRPGDLAPVQQRLVGTCVIVALGTGLRSSDAGAKLQQAGGVVVEEATPPSTLYGAADIFLLTSAWEALPLSVLEASLASLPVVSYAVGDVAAVVSDGTSGYLHEVGDVEAMARSVKKLARADSSRRAMGVQARSLVSAKFSVENMVDAIVGEYLKAARNPRSARKAEQWRRT